MRQAVCDAAPPDGAGTEGGADPNEDPNDGPLTLRWRHGPSCRVEGASDGLRVFLGWQEPLAGAVLGDVLHGEDHQRFLDEVADALRRGQDRVCHADHRVTRRNGGTTWWRTVTLLRPVPGGGVRCVSHAFDITALRSEAMEAEPPGAGRTLLQALIDSIPDLIFFKRPDSVYLGCNRAFADFLGRSVGEIVGRTDFDLIPVDRAAFFRERDADILRLREPHRMEETVHFPDGRTALLETIKTPYYGPDGGILGLVGVARDITEKDRTRRDLRTAEDTLRTLSLAVEQSPVAVVITDALGKTVYLNPCFHRLTGLAADAVPDLDALLAAIAGGGRGWGRCRRRGVRRAGGGPRARPVAQSVRRPDLAGGNAGPGR